MNNPCTECGKQRIDGKTWEEKVGTSTITHTQTVCPDADCQKIVDSKIADRLAKNALLTKERLEAKTAREKLLAATAS